MKVISDIRLYKSSEIDNRSGISNKALNLSLHRVVMKLREYGFSLGEYDHIYMNFTTMKPADSIELIDKADPYHPWYRYCDIGVSKNEYENLENSNFVFEKLKIALLNLFDMQNIIEQAFEEAKQGAEMLMCFKKKKIAKGTANVYLRLLDNGNYLPILCVTDSSENEVFRIDLPETIDLNIIGEIQLSSKKVTIKPRRNVFAKELQPISFEIKL